MKIFHKVDFRKIDYVILTIITLLTGAGLFCLRHIAQTDPEKANIFKTQIIGFGLGIFLIAIILFIDYQFICKVSPLLYLFILGILFATLKMGEVVRHVRRWIKIAGIQFQPSELCKIVLIVFLAYLCYLFKDKQKKFYPFFILAACTVIPMILILKEPHLSPCIVIIALFCIIILVSGISYKVLMTISLITVPIVAILLTGILYFNWNLPLINKYQVQRVINHITAANSNGDSKDDNGKYQQNLSLAAISSGGAYGKALSHDDSPRKYESVYSNESDFIFCAVAEEYGFTGCCIIIFLYLILVLRCLKIASHAPDLMGKIIATAVSALFMFQGFINIGVATDLLPNTGMPFPFFSYGLTSLVSSMIAVGLVLDIKVQSK